MANKSGLITSINGYITAVVNITKLRNAFLDLVNSLFQTTTTQSLSTGSNIFWHNLRFKKIGNIVYIDGTIQSKYLTTVNSVVLVTISESQYYAKTGQDTVVRCNADMGDCVISFSTSSINLVGSISPNQIVNVNAHYQTND